ncbi:hypothetical protein SAMN05421839_1483 [Halolactibacillus halophilus]|uniref:UPF0699 transmembrane protein YdbS n=1 Tax=Halolactibacillus halophilus TaxID=306540 RepID=A0A1I5SMV4_9BACI|nr:PH domain-containing protein [Halolactibacillus halophilus]GEM02621.1 UPF0699 transmembrane protein YdbS [Halolactibacillus halophilus]SFP72049.1 hypothetical protein SAMN05421839_1483 [Halolactibacillus halophilus]
MRQPPKHQLAKAAITVWRLSGIITFIILMVMAGALTYIAYRFEWPWFIGTIAISLTLLEAMLHILIIPTIRYKRFRYEILDEEIYIQRGLLIVTRTLVPMTRIQHVDTKQGPILKKYNLMTVTISTAATTHEIPALPSEVADQLRNDIAVRARVIDDD